MDSRKKENCSDGVGTILTRRAQCGNKVEPKEEHVAELLLFDEVEQVFPSHAGEALPKLEEEVLDARDEGAFELLLVAFLTEDEEIEAIGALRHLPGQIAVDIREGRFEVRQRLPLGP